jgi:hypothetical protein
VPLSVPLLTDVDLAALCGVCTVGALSDLMLRRPRGGVPWMVESGFLYVFVEARKLGVPSSGPELEPGLLLALDEARKEPWL